jgi:ABC-type ATPase involved in cell division
MKNNLVSLHKMYILGCTLMLGIVAMGTFVILSTHTNKVRNTMKTTYIYARNGAAIQVSVQKKK